MLLAILRQAAVRVLLALFTLVVAADVLWIDRTLVEGRSKPRMAGAVSQAGEYLDNAGATRVYSPSYSLAPTGRRLFECSGQFGGVDPFQVEAYLRAAEAATGVHASGYSVTVPAFERGQCHSK